MTMIFVPQQTKDDPVPAEMWKLLHYATASYHRRKSRAYTSVRRHFTTEDFAVAVAKAYGVVNDVAFAAESMRNIRWRLRTCPRVNEVVGKRGHWTFSP